MFCPKCGRQYADEAKFCPGCGAPSRKAAEAPAPAPAPAPPPPSSVKEPEVKAARDAKPPAQAAPPPPVPQQDEEEVPPPPSSGMILTFRANQQGRMERVTDAAKNEPAPAAVSGGTAETCSSTAGTSSVNAAEMLAAASVDCTLPPQGPVWSFRVQTGALADRIVGGFSAPAGGQPNPFLEAVGRLVRGVLLHKDVYRTAASRGSLMKEALVVALLLIVVSTMGLSIGNLFGQSAAFTIKLVLIRVLSWAGSVFAVQWVAKTQQKVDLPPAAWFRAMVYAQAGLLLTILPVLNLGTLIAIWGAVCTVAALQDVSGKDTTAGIVLLVVAGAANLIIASVLVSVLI